jgi:hypothetical protein
MFEVEVQSALCLARNLQVSPFAALIWVTVNFLLIAVQLVFTHRTTKLFAARPKQHLFFSSHHSLRAHSSAWCHFRVTYKTPRPI